MLFDDAFAEPGLSSAQPPMPAMATVAAAPPAMTVRRSIPAGIAAGRLRARGFPRFVSRVRPVAVPRDQRQRLGFAEAQRQVDLVDEDGDIDVPLLCTGSLVLDERAFLADRTLAPGDNDAFGGVELFFDRMAPLGASADLLVPPDGIALTLQGIDERLHAALVFSLVRDENVAHRSAPGPL